MFTPETSQMDLVFGDPSLSLNGKPVIMIQQDLWFLCMSIAIIDEDILRYERVKKKAYIRITTNLGNLNLELHSEMVNTDWLMFLLLQL